MRRNLLSVLVFGASACAPAATVTLGDAPPFGDVVDATWSVGSDVDAWVIDGGRLQHYGAAMISQLLVTDYPLDCADLTAELAAATAASEALVEAVGDNGKIDADRGCAEMSALVATIAERPPPPRHYLSLGVSVPPTRLPEERTYDATSDGVSGTLVYIEDEAGCGRWDPETCGWTSDEPPCDASVWTTDTAVLEVTKAGRVLQGTVRATLVEQPFEVASGRMTVDFRAEVCELPALGAFVFY